MGKKEEGKALDWNIGYYMRYQPDNRRKQHALSHNMPADVVFVAKINGKDLYACTLPTFTKVFNLLLIFIYCDTVDGLIGLRPPSATYSPHPVRPVAGNKPVIHDRRVTDGYNSDDDIKLFILQRSRPHSPVRQEVIDKVTALQHQTPPEVAPKLKGLAGSCRPSAVLKCTIRFLKDYLRNNTTICQHIEELETCVLEKIEACDLVASRQAYIILNNVKALIPISGHHACGRSTHALPKSLDNKLNYSPCCVVNLLECMARTYRELLDDRKSCDAVTDFTSCSAFSFRSYDSQPAERIFQSIMTLTRTCIHSRKPYSK
ncbi:uncharacterized protein LOC132561177 [Ylistrum balloti]|uniref:uncharacterized protein LOC132561177 n=1 Tax=Ylistrum balloti TaxID=509963 RepID=UPI0029058994|nr:uncharacterized protein LOC132561177 [Ylistrum balloti]